MLDIATRRANAKEISNFETRVCSADDLPFSDAAFDSVSVRFGYMFLPDLARATTEFARVLKRDGRLCASVWVRPEANPWTTVVMQAIAAETLLVPPGPDGPNMYRCAASGYVSALYEAAGLREVSEWDVDVALVTESPGQCWDMMSEHVSLAVAALRQVDDPARERTANRPGPRPCARCCSTRDTCRARRRLRSRGAAARLRTDSDRTAPPARGGPRSWSPARGSAPRPAADVASRHRRWPCPPGTDSRRRGCWACTPRHRCAPAPGAYHRAGCHSPRYGAG